MPVLTHPHTQLPQPMHLSIHTAPLIPGLKCNLYTCYVPGTVPASLPCPVPDTHAQEPVHGSGMEAMERGGGAGSP